MRNRPLCGIITGRGFPLKKDNIKNIPLQNSVESLRVDDKDYEWLSSYSWSLHKGYAATRLYGQWVYAHRLVLGAPPGDVVDHKNRNRLDCRRDNLRIASQAENASNRSKRGTGTSRYKGVSFNAQSGKWVASITTNGVRLGLGSHEDEMFAAQVYDAAAADLHGDYAVLNFPGRTISLWAWATYQEKRRAA